jgi:LysR family transcriptional activator of nhaA
MAHVEALNYQHLSYFVTIAAEGSLVGAGRRLRLTHSTLSAQLRALEQFLGGELFERRGRRLVLTPRGAEIAGFAGEIFRMGGELVELARGRAAGRQAAFTVGVVGNVPKSVAQRLLAPVLVDPSWRPVTLRQDSLSRLIEELAAGRLHVVLSDELPRAGGFRLHAHALGATQVYLYAARAEARRYRREFPRSLDDAPLVLPAAGTLRRSVERWLAERGLRINLAAAVEDSGMLRVIGGGGLGLFPVRAMLRTEVEESLGASSVGRLTGVRETYYALSVDRRIRHAAVAAIVENARAQLESH